VIGNPATAPKRNDLPFLRHRALPKPAAPTAVSDFVAGHATNPQHRHPTSPVPPAPPSSSLDLDAPASRPAAPPAPATSSLDLDSAPAPAPVVRTARPPARQDPRLPAVVRVRAHEQRLLSVKAPTVTLTRLQSGVGTLMVEAITSVPHLRIGCAYQLANGATSTVQLAGGNRFAPPTTRRPVIVAHREQYEQLTFDLRQVDKLERLIVYAFADDGSQLTWGGTLVTTTYGGGRIELPLDTLYAGAVAVPLSITNVAGELWVRAEMENIAGPIRDACRAYGFDRITWKDESTPAD
jgi:uncharacterized protein involved in tellurium resistance